MSKRSKVFKLWWNARIKYLKFKLNGTYMNRLAAKKAYYEYLNAK